MAQPGYIFGKGTPDTYESLRAKRKTAERLGVAAMRTPSNVGEGFASLGQAIAYRRMMNQADTGDAAGRAASDSAFAQIMAGMGGMGGSDPRISSSGTWDRAAPPPKPTDLPGMGAQPLSYGSTSRTVDTPAGKRSVTGSPIPGMPQIGGGGLDFGSATMTPQEMLIAGAEARGLDPIDVATAISYETGATMDPMISGPTTQWGTHQGLIQFGEPQAAEHGADFSDPNTAMRSQLNPTSGAVWSYLDKAGVQPGMGLDNIYSAINAGAPGRFNASDANNGGAPGTVGDKVAGMGDHRGKAAEWLGGTWTPSDNVTVSTQGAPQGGGASIPALMEAMSDPYASEAQRSVLGMMLQQQLTAMQPQSESERLDLLLKRAELDQIQNPVADPMEAVKMEQALLDLEQDKAGPPPDAPPTSVREYQFYADQAKAAGQPALSYEEWDLRGKKAGASSTSVDLGGGSDKQIFDAMLVDRNMAQSSVSALTALNEAEAAVDSGIVSGAGANTLLLGQKVAAAFGYDPEEIVNTETFVSAMAPVVAATLKASAGTANLSNADMEFAKKAAAGDITLEAKSIKRLLKILRNANETTVKTYNDRLNGVYPDAEDPNTKRSRAMLRVGDIPVYAPPPPAADPGAAAPAPSTFLSNPVIQKAAKDAGVTEQEIYDAMSPDVRAKYGASQ
jgi:hypothetical protein